MTGQRGRPLNEARQLALLTGETTYVGKRCRVCGCTEHYTKGGSCVDCTKSKADKVRAQERRSRKRKQRRIADAEMNELLGLNGNSSMSSVDVDSCHNDACTPEVSDIAEEPNACTLQPPVNSLCSRSNIPVVNADTTGMIHRVQNRDLGSGSVQTSDPAAESMAYDAHASDSPNKAQLRYWCHPESGCVWTTPATEEHPGDGLVEEIGEESYRDCLAAGFTETTKLVKEIHEDVTPAVNPSDDLSDIL